MTRARTGAGLRKLRPSIRAEIDRLENERRRLVALLEFIDDYAGALPRGHGRSQTLLELVEAHPGIRLSMLVNVLGRSRDDLARELGGCERGGLVERHGLGWRARR